MIVRLLGFAGILLIVGFALTTGLLLDFVYFYPLFMSFVWIIGGVYFYYHWERRSPGPETEPVLKEYPFVTIIVPCFNEGANVEDTIAAANNQNWPEFEIIAVNDGSTDDTGPILDRLAKQYPKLRVIHFAKNQGKAMALRMGALAARGEYLVTVDGDALLHPNAAGYLVKPMINNPRVGAVTGNPRIRTRATLMGRVQVGEFSSVSGLIKRAQRIYGQIFTVSGVIAAFRRRAVHDCGYWDLTMVTEDIDISWSLQLKHWQIQYEPCALAWILMPETFRGLWKQRLRWAQGGAEVFFKNLPRIWNYQDRRMWGLLADFIFGSAWAYSYAVAVILWSIGKFVPLPAGLYVPTIWPPAFWGLVLATLSLWQFVTAIVIESRYDHKLPGTMFWVIWYPFFFWGLSLFTTLVGVPAAVFGAKKRAIWHSQDRGFQ
jgi:biofilm PGA synthesis N-glycosyltransferase PgaC